MSTGPKVDPELVTVFDTQDEPEAMVVQALLTSAGIESLISTLMGDQNILPAMGGVVVRVNAAQAEDARSIIEDYRETPDTIEEDDDPDAEPL